ncbi:MAG: tetratricopeptide repeat protein [Syntrophobacteraceae bacterium]
MNRAPYLFAGRRGGRYLEALVKRSTGDEKGSALKTVAAVFLDAINRQPRVSSIHYNLGVLYYARKLYKRARRCFERALTADSKFEAVQQMLDKLDRTTDQEASGL